MKRWQILVIAVAAVALVAGAAYLALTHTEVTAPEQTRNITVLVYYEGAWSGLLSDAVASISIDGRDRTGESDQVIRRFIMPNARGFIDLAVRKGDGSDRQMRVLVLPEEGPAYADLVTTAPYGVIVYRVQV